MRVDLPAPFSPRSACTSPSRTSRSTRSLASTPGNRFVIPRSSRTGISSTMLRGILGGGLRPPPKNRLQLNLLRGDLDLAGDDRLLDLVQLLDDRRALRRPLVDRSNPHAAVLEREVHVEAALELARALLERLRREEDRVLDLLQRARQHRLRMQVVLVGVDADAPLAGAVRRAEPAEAAAPGRREDDLRFALQLVERDLLALRLIVEGQVVRVAVDDRDLRVGPRGARLVAGEVAHDRRNGVRADAADDLRPLLVFDDEAGDVPNQVASLLLAELEAANVPRMGLELREVDVDAGELRVRELRRDAVEPVAHEEADAEDQVVA